MKNNWKKGIAALLTASMLFANMGSLGLAADVAQEPAAAAAEEPQTTEPQTTEAPATEPQTTEAPATEAPVTEAPATEPQTTEAPATEAPATEPQTTEAPATEAPVTEAPATEPQTTEAPVTETSTEKKTEAETTEAESETEKGLFTVEEKDYTISVRLPESVELPEGTKLTAKVLKAGAETFEDDLALAEKKNGSAFKECLIYDLHFEKNGNEVKLDERDKEDIKVTFTFAKTEFKGVDFTDSKLKLYHIKDMTAQELEDARSAALLDAEENGSEAETEELPEQKAVEIRLEQKQEKGGVTVDFKTDGFSDYVFGIPKDTQETEAAATDSTESETETETEEETQVQQPLEAEAEEAQVAAVNDPGNALTIHFEVKGAESSASHPIIITGDTAITAETPPIVKIKENPVEAPYDSTANCLQINVPATVVSADIVVEGLAKGSYTIDAGGKYIKDDALQGNADYTTYYDGGDLYHGTEPMKLTLGSTGEELTVTDSYTAVNVSLNDKTSKTGVTGGVFKLQRQINNEWKDIAGTSVTTAAGAAAVKGLPFGKYRAVCESVPGIYVYASVSVPVEAELNKEKNELTASAGFTTSQIAIRVRAVDPSGNKLSGAEFDLNGNKLDGTNNTLRGVLERGVAYSLKQTVTPYGYVKPKNVRVTPQDSSKVQVVQMVNKPTIVRVSAVAKATGAKIPGVTFEIRDSSGKAVNGCTWTSTSDVQELRAKLQPGTKYTLVQTSVPDGYYLAASKTFTVSKDGSIDTVTMTNEMTRVSISRKGYDSRTKKADGKYEYKNMKMVSGAVLEVQDLNGNAIERWTSSEEPHIIQGKLAAGGKYRLVEITSPSGYEKGGQGEFVVKTKEKILSTKNVTTSVTMQTGRPNGKIQVVKRAALNGNAIKLDQTYYCALFLDEAKTQMYKDGGVKALHMTSDAVYTSATFTNVPSGVYYVAETDSSGKVLSGSEGSPAYTITITNEKLNLSVGASLLAEIVNDYKSEPSGGYKKVNAQELKKSYKDEYAAYGGSAQAAAAMAAGDGTVATGDNTNIMIYVILLAAAVLIIGAGIVIKKKKR